MLPRKEKPPVERVSLDGVGELLPLNSVGKSHPDCCKNNSTEDRDQQRSLPGNNTGRAQM
jgi:hypothetical protein